MDEIYLNWPLPPNEMQRSSNIYEPPSEQFTQFPVPNFVPFCFNIYWQCRMCLYKPTEEQQCTLLRQDITFTRQDFYEANFMSFSAVAEQQRLPRPGRISFTPAPPRNIWLPPTQDRNFAIAPESGLDCWPGQSAPASTLSQQTEFYKEKKKNNYKLN